MVKVKFADPSADSKEEIDDSVYKESVVDEDNNNDVEGGNNNGSGQMSLRTPAEQLL